MKSSRAGLTMLVCAAAFAFLGTPSAVSAAEDHELHIHNMTGHAVDVYVFTDDAVHHEGRGGHQEGHLEDGETGTAHVPTCKFAIVLEDGEDIWHAEFHDCHSTDLTITSSTGHEKKKKKK